MKWEIKETDANLDLMSEVLQINKITACVMANRGIRTKNTAISFLVPSAERMHDTMRMKDMQKALKRISAAIENNEKIMVYGDYDVDGITSTVILYKALQKLNACCEYYIPHRIDEGYGLNLNAAKKIAESVNLLIAVDNGISSIEETLFLKENGVDTIVIDHHEPTETLPTAVAVIDPKQQECEYPFKELCAGGLTYKFAKILCDFMQNPLSETEHDEFMMLAAIATICDIVELSDENRIIVKNGLEILNKNKLINAGLGTLITMRGYLDKPIDAHTVGFLIGPCLNATGRLKSASVSVELLLSQKTEERMPLAQELINLNEERKAITAECVERAKQFLGEEIPKVLVLTDFEAHESIAGIVAGRIRDIVNRPTILLTKGDNAVKGSGRSIHGYNLFESLYKHQHLFIRFGGHAMAAGLSLPEENIDTLRINLNNDCTLTEEDFLPKILIDRELSLEEISLVLSEELSRLAPFGKGNHEPLFVSYNMLAESVRIIDEKNTLIFTFITKNNRRLKGIAFGLNENYAAAGGKKSSVTIDAVYTIETNVWNDIRSAQIRLKDFRIVSD